MVHHEVEHHPDPPPVSLRDQPVEVVEGPEDGIDRVVVGDVVADVEAGRGMDGRQPDRVDPEGPLRAVVEVVELVDQPGQVTDPVAVRIGEGAGIDLVDDAALPPIAAKCRTDDGMLARR